MFISKNIPVVPRPSCSPDLSSCDLFLFSRLKTILKGQRFENVNENIRNTTEELKTITLEEIQRYFQKWQDHWNHCVEAK